MLMNFYSQNQQVDLCFYNSLLSLQQDQKIRRFFYAFRFVFVLWYLIIHLRIQFTEDTQTYNNITLLFLFLLISNILTATFSHWILNNMLFDSQFLYQIAQKTQNSKIIDINNIEDTNSYYTLNNPSLNVSKVIYQFSTNLLISQINPQFIKSAQMNCKNRINFQLNSHRWYKFWNGFFNLASISIFIYSIIIISQPLGITSSERTFMIIYLVSQIFSRLFIYLILIFLSLSPFCCIGFFVYSCFCKKDKIIQLPKAEPASIDIIRQCQGQCPICWQNFNESDSVIVLKCSSKHVFHEICIKGWSKVGKTCPVCRAEL